MARLNVERTRHYRDCPVCDGQGEVTVNASDLGDPQCEEPAPCPNSRCFNGEVIVWEDPLLRLASWRTAITSWRSVGYWKARHAAMKPVTLPRYPEPYIERLRRKDPMAAAILGPVFDGMVRMAAQSRAA